MRWIPLLILLLAGSPSGAQTYTQYTAEKLMQRVRNADTVYVVNCWATWCLPCVRELPVFDTLQRMYGGRPVKVLLLSFDFKEDYQDKINRYVSRRKPLPEIAWFSETNAGKFIPVIDDRWSGALPATLIVAGGRQDFIEGTVTVPDISSRVDSLLMPGR